MKEVDVAEVAKLVSALKSIDISEKQLADLQRLYESSRGFPYTIDNKNAPQAETLESCRRVGSSIKRALGITSSQSYGMNQVGYRDRALTTWRMRPSFRSALDSLGWFSDAESGHPAESMGAIEDRFQEEVRVSSADSVSARAARLAVADARPKRITVTQVVFDRNADVVAQVLFEAKGCCQSCGKKAPFKRTSDGSPYLEVHHCLPLAKGGDDTVANAIALCPNCHRKMHFGV